MTISVNIHEAKAQLSHLLHLIEQGEVVQICRRNVPVAEVRAVEKKPIKKRPFGLYKGQITIPDSFFDPMDEEELALWNGEGPLYYTKDDMERMEAEKAKKQEERNKDSQS